MRKLYKSIIILVNFSGTRCRSSNGRLGCRNFCKRRCITLVDGKETVDNTNVNTATAEAAFVYPSIFVEKNLGSFTVGFDFVPVQLETTEASRTDTNPLQNDSDSKDGKVNKAKGEVKNHATLYVSLPAGDTGAYLKLGYSMMEVISKENLGTGSDYGNDDVGGYHGSVGYQHDLDDSFIRFELGYSAYDDINLTNGTNSSLSNKVEGSLEGATAKISFGKTF